MRIDFHHHLITAITITCLSFSLGAQNLLLSNQEIADELSSSPFPIAPAIEKAEAYYQKTKKGYKQYKRIEEHMLNRLGPKGTVVNSTALNYEAFNRYMQQGNRSVASNPTTHNGYWTFMGPTETNGNVSGMGRVSRIAFHPTDPDILFASSGAGGVWKTTNGGLDWYPLSDGIPVMNTSGIAVDYTDPDVLYVLSGEGDAKGDFLRPSLGVIKSTDGGTTWQPTGLYFDEMTIVKPHNLYIDPENHLRLYACTNKGLFRTEDGGTVWDTLRGGNIYELQFKPGSAHHIYCVDQDYCYVSDDHGDTWIDSTLIPPIDEKTGRMCITTSPANPEIVYLIAAPIDTLSETDSIPDHRGLWRSLNSGADFDLMSTRPNLMAGSSGLEFKDQSWYDFGMTCDPLDASHLFVCSIGMWESTNSGVLWMSDNGINNLYHADVHDVRINPLDQKLYICTDGGVFMSDDMGETYEFRSIHLACTQYYKLAVSPFDENTVIAGAQDNGVHLRDADDSSFSRVLWGDGQQSLFHPTNSQLVITSAQEGEVHLSMNGGYNFSQIFHIPKGDTATWTTLVALNASDDSLIYLGFKPIMRSIDRGATFSAISADTISAHMILENNLSNPAYMYAGDCRNCNDSAFHFDMYHTPDAGLTWNKIDGNPGFPDTSYVMDASVNPYDSWEIWICCGRYDAPNKVFRSVDAGATWTNETGNLPNVPLNAIVFQYTEGSPTGAVYVASDVGVYYRDDDLGDWIYFSDGLPRVEVTDLDIDYLGGRLRASTYGRGLWQSPLYAPCSPILALNTTNQQLGLSYVHHATNQITSTAQVDGYGSNVIYRCENVIYLNEGFHASARKGASFISLLAPCDASGILYPFSQPGGHHQFAERKDNPELFWDD